MNLVKNMRWAVIAASILGGSAHAAPITCTLTPVNTILTEGQTLQLSANCESAVLTSINWYMNNTGDGLAAKSVTGDIPLSGHVAGQPILYTTPVGLSSSGTGDFRFTVTGVSAGNTISSTEAQVIVQPTSAVLARAVGVATPTTPVNGHCGTANGIAVTAMPVGTALCNPGKAALAISGPSSFTWTCTSLNGGTEDNCYALRGTMYTVNATDGGSPNGAVTPTSQQVVGGTPATVTATPATGYNTSWSSTCGGTPSVNSFTVGAVNANCTVTASFTTAPAAVNGACGSSNGLTLSAAPAANLCSAGTASSVTTGTSTYTWSCAGSNGGSTASCSAAKTVTSPGSDPGSGSWVPPGTSNRLIADQSGSSAIYRTTYAPGCLNGDAPPTSSGSGCGGSTTYGGSSGFAFGSGSVLGVRYMSRNPVSTSVKYFRINSGDGGNLGQSMKAWLSTDPMSTYDTTDANCRWVSTTTLYAATGPGYCVILPSTRYYLFMSIDATGTGYRYKVDELSADFD